jgi:hypothetical protein
MKAVVQEDRTGCGIAAVAAIAGVNYVKAKAVAASLGISPTDPGLWSEIAPIRRLSDAFGMYVSRTTKPFRAWESLPDCALLAIKWHLEEGQPRWHWVVFVREREGAYVLDSNSRLRTSTRTDFGRIKPAWFLTVRSSR